MGAFTNSSHCRIPAAPLSNACDGVKAVRMSMMLSGVAFAPQIQAAAARHHLDPRLLAAVAAQETGGPGNNSGRNVTGDGGHGHGLFQIDDRFHAFARTAAAGDPGKNADYAAGMLSESLRQYGGDVHKALAAYNAGDPDGTGTVTQWGDGTRLGYADSVLRHYSEIAGTPIAQTPSGGAGSSQTNGMSFLSNIVHGVESGLGALAMTGNPIVAAGAGVLGAIDAGGSSTAANQDPFATSLLPDLQSELPSTQQNVNGLSNLANTNQNMFGDLINPDASEDS